MAAMPILEMKQVAKAYGEGDAGCEILSGIDLSLEEGEFIAIVVFSGSGKTTLISLMAGLVLPDSGEVFERGKRVEGPGHERGIVFHLNRVYPHAKPAERREIVEYYLARVGLADSMHRLASELSNGMKRRVGIARAFALSPKLLLLDEPFGMLDSLTRWELQDVLMEVWKRTQVTAICVTHDVDEAILLGDRAYREKVLEFLEEYEHGAKPAPSADRTGKPAHPAKAA